MTFPLLQRIDHVLIFTLSPAVTLHTVGAPHLQQHTEHYFNTLSPEARWQFIAGLIDQTRVMTRSTT